MQGRSGGICNGSIMRSPPRVLFVTGRDPTEGQGGGSNYCRAHARAAREAGYETHVFCLGETNAVIETDFARVHRVATRVRPPRWLQVAPGVEPQRIFAHWLALNMFDARAAMLHGPAMSRALVEFMERRPGPHLMHGFFTWGSAGLRAGRLMAQRGVEVKVVNSFYTTARHEVRGKERALRDAGGWRQHGPYVAERLWVDLVTRRWERAAYHQSDLALVNYDSVRRLLRAEYGERANVLRLPYSPESAFFEKSSADPEMGFKGSEPPRIVCVSRHDPRKGLNVLLRALALLRDHGVAFHATLVSGGPLFTVHHDMVRSLELDRLVELTNWVPDPFPYLMQSDVFVLPSLEEGSGSISLLEAMQLGKAIVASGVDGILEDVEHERSALLVPPGCPASLMEALRRVLHDADLRVRLGSRAETAFWERFSAEIFAEGLAAAYGQVGFRT